MALYVLINLAEGILRCLPYPRYFTPFLFFLYSSLPLPTKEKEKKAQNTGGTVGTTS
jgi:hypothetical protein